jgi:hypothetical protein
MLREVCDTCEPIAENRNIDLRVEVKHRLNVCGDRDLLFGAVANLVGNAFIPDPVAGWRSYARTANQDERARSTPRTG